MPISTHHCVNSSKSIPPDPSKSMKLNESCSATPVRGTHIARIIQANSYLFADSSSPQGQSAGGRVRKRKRKRWEASDAEESGSRSAAIFGREAAMHAQVDGAVAVDVVKLKPAAQGSVGGAAHHAAEASAGNVRDAARATAEAATEERTCSRS